MHGQWATEICEKSFEFSSAGELGEGYQALRGGRDTGGV